jgi:RNA polymerase sigma factor (sigma-70 family)
MTELERNIVQGCLKGEKSFQKQLYDTYSKKMYTLCMRYSNDPDQAKDLLQDGFIKVFQNLHTFKGEGSFEGWMRRILVNVCLESFRKLENKFPHGDILEAENEYSTHTSFQKFDIAYVLKKIQQLAPGYRAVFNLHIMEGYPHQEIAGMLGISESTSKSQLSRARKLLQEQLAGEYSNLNER